MEEKDSYPSPVALIAAITIAHRLDLKFQRKWRQYKKIRLYPHGEPEGDIYVPDSLEELFLSRPQRFILLIIDSNRYNHLKVGDIVDIICMLVDEDVMYHCNVGYYKVAGIHHTRDTFGLHRDLTVIDLIWIRRRGDVNPYDIYVVYDEDGLYRFAKINEDGADFLFDSLQFKCKKNRFYPIEETD